MKNQRRGYPFGFLAKKWSRRFIGGFLALVLLMTAIDRLFADFEYIRLVDLLLITTYGVVWSLLYWMKPDLFKDK